MKKDTLISSLFILGGIALAAVGITSLRSANQLRGDQNPFAIQQSAYGKLFARLSETTIDRVWHLGVEQIVPHYMSGIEHGEAKPVIEPGSPPSKDATTDLTEVLPRPVDSHGNPIPLPKKTLLANGKRWFQDRVIAQYTRTNPNALNQRHLNTVYSDIEHLLLRSFKMDPTHYGAYDSYHMFLTTYNLGGNPNLTKQARLIANVAIAAAQPEKEDPEPWLTAAAAGMNLYLMDSGPYTEKGEPVPLDMLKEYRNQIGFFLARFEELHAQSEIAGNWQRLSMDRQMEIVERDRFVARTFKQFDVMIARAEAKSDPAPGEGDVAKTEDNKDE